MMARHPSVPNFILSAFMFIFMVVKNRKGGLLYEAYMEGVVHFDVEVIH
jgi:hypothetical protein